MRCRGYGDCRLVPGFIGIVQYATDEKHIAETLCSQIHGNALRAHETWESEHLSRKNSLMGFRNMRVISGRMRPQ